MKTLDNGNNETTSGGTYSPAFFTTGTPTYTTQSGMWSKIGKMVTISIEFVASITGAGGNAIIIYAPPGFTGGGLFNQDCPVARGASTPIQAGAPYYLRIGGTSNLLQLHDKDGVSVKASGGNWSGEIKTTFSYIVE